MTPTMRIGVGRASLLLLGLLLAAGTLAGCHAAGPGSQPTPPAQTPAPRPASRAPTAASGCDQERMHNSIEDPGTQRFEITRQQLAVVNSHLIEVLCRQGLWQRDVGFGFNYERDPNRVFVLINPGRSGLTAKQVLDRLLGR